MKKWRERSLRSNATVSLDEDPRETSLRRGYSRSTAIILALESPRKFTLAQGVKRPRATARAYVREISNRRQTSTLRGSSAPLITSVLITSVSRAGEHAPLPAKTNYSKRIGVSLARDLPPSRTILVLRTKRPSSETRSLGRQPKYPQLVIDGGNAIPNPFHPQIRRTRRTKNAFTPRRRTSRKKTDDSLRPESLFSRFSFLRTRRWSKGRTRAPLIRGINNERFYRPTGWLVASQPQPQPQPQPRTETRFY